MARTLMIQGTMSNAGKSLITAGLLRIMKEDGFLAAPFKSQNMALNSYITREGLEMGRAQAVQAEAAGAEPEADMNPILLKPTTDTGSQVIVHGIHRGNMTATQYFAYKKSLIPQIMESFHRLERQYDLIVIEGAGSPAEINLKQDDIVNMGLARMTDSPVLLVGDIDRGGVFAQLYGTVMLLEEEERQRIKGLIINKFRGDKTILDPGVVMIEELCSIPVLGVTPYLDVDLEDEDSLGDHLLGSGQTGLADIAVIRLPRISNFTDFQPFLAIPEISVRYVGSLRELGKPDMIILPGTKSTMDDLLWLRREGLEAAVVRHASRGLPVLGICGGYQMMGMTLRDPLGAESSREFLRGMELLPVDTVFGEDKMRTRVKGTFGQLEGLLSPLSGKQVEGYEIHMGTTKPRKPGRYMAEVTEDQGDPKADGSCLGSCYGTYLHGLFDGEGVASLTAEILLKAKGIHYSPGETVSYREYKDSQYSRLAKELRKHLDMDRIYEIMGVKR